MTNADEVQAAVDINRSSSPHLNVAVIRKSIRGIGHTQRSFAEAISVSVKTLRNWEQHRRKPTGPASVLLSLIQKEPMIVLSVLNGKHCRSQGTNE